MNTTNSTFPFRFNQVSIQYGDKRTLRFPSFDLQTGEHLCITGNSGTGKTSLLQACAGLLPLHSGSVSFGSNTFHQPQPAWEKLRREQLAFLFQTPVFVPWLNNLQNILLKQATLEQIYSLTDLLGVSEHLSKKPTQVSQGELFRLQLVQVLAHQPHLVLCDEPTANLDDTNTDLVIQLLKTHLSQSRSVIIVSHDQRLLEHFPNQLAL